MNPRWFGSVAALIACAGLASAQAPMPAEVTSSTPQSPASLVPVNNVPSTSTAQPPKTTEVKPASASSEGTAPASAPAAPPAAVAVDPAAVSPAGVEGTFAPGGSYFDDNCAPYRHFWVRTEYLVWWLKNMPLRTVLGTIPDADASMLELPENAITPRFGNQTVNFGALSGARIEVGAGLDRDSTWGISGEFFQLENGSRGETVTSNGSGSPTLGPVFFDPKIGKQVILLFSVPGTATGTAGDIVDNRLWGFEVDARRRLPTIFSDRLDFIIGYRHIQFDESLDAGATTTAINTAPSPVSEITYFDHFGARNNFDGAVIGLESEYDVGHCFLDVRGKFGLGNNHESYTVFGVTNFTSTLSSFPSQQFPGGVLAQPTNSGTFSRNRVDFLGEITVNGGIRFWENHAKVYVGYNFLGLSKVLRAGQVIDDVNSNVVASEQGPMRTIAVSAPAPRIDDGRFWAEGVNLGLSFEF
jgi:hypothetical protein